MARVFPVWWHSRHAYYPWYTLIYLLIWVCSVNILFVSIIGVKKVSEHVYLSIICEISDEYLGGKNLSRFLDLQLMPSLRRKCTSHVCYQIKVFWKSFCNLWVHFPFTIHPSQIHLPTPISPISLCANHSSVAIKVNDMSLFCTNIDWPWFSHKHLQLKHTKMHL